VQVADRRSVDRRLHLLRPPLVGRPLLHRARPVAYQPQQTKKKSGATELARSLRRYI
jgi:hypothetical protein